MPLSGHRRGPTRKQWPAVAAHGGNGSDAPSCSYLDFRASAASARRADGGRRAAGAGSTSHFGGWLLSGTSRPAAPCVSSALAAAAPAAPATVGTLPGLAPAEELGVNHHDDGSVSFRVWAPCAREVWLEAVPDAAAFAPPEVPADHPVITDAGVPVLTLPLARAAGGDTWAGRFSAAALPVGAAYRVRIVGPEGQQLERRDPYARKTDYNSNWCFVTRPDDYAWK